MTRQEALQVAKPILFNPEMVRAIQGGTKTVTRRLIKPPAEVHECSDGIFITRPRKYPDEYCKFEPYNPYKIGDILYVRETWCKGKITGEDERYYYKADNNLKYHCQWSPSIHMPKEAARIFLRVTSVRVERLQDCGNMEAKDEGCTCCGQFIRLWNSTVKKSDLDKYGWEANPWVWVIEFERLEVTE